MDNVTLFLIEDKIKELSRLANKYNSTANHLYKQFYKLANVNINDDNFDEILTEVLNTLKEYDLPKSLE